MHMETLYKLDSKGRLREWHLEVDSGRYRSIAGLVDGKKVVSEWTHTESKNIGKSNETTAKEQAHYEAIAMYTDKLSKDYHESIEDVKKDRFYKPMLATSWDKRKDKINFHDGVFVQPKLDGIRCIVTRDGAFSRQGKPITAVPHIVEALSPIFEEYPDTIFDGELYNHELKSDFNKIVSLVRKATPGSDELASSAELIQYHVYDLPVLHQDDANDDFSYRLENLNYVMSYLDYPMPIWKVNTTMCHSFGDIDQAYGYFLEQGYEGGIIRLDEPYQQKRSNNLIKRKDFEDKEFEIVRIEEGKGNWTGAAKRVIFRLEDGRECGAGMKGSRDRARQILAEADQYIGKQVTVQYFTRTPDGVPRFPIAKALHKNERW